MFLSRLDDARSFYVRGTVLHRSWDVFSRPRECNLGSDVVFFCLLILRLKPMTSPQLRRPRMQLSTKARTDSNRLEPQNMFREQRTCVATYACTAACKQKCATQCMQISPDSAIRNAPHQPSPQPPATSHGTGTSHHPSHQPPAMAPAPQTCPRYYPHCF